MIIIKEYNIGNLGHCLNKCEKFLTRDEVLLDKELTVRETVKLTTGGQGLSSCSCKSKSPCQTSRCGHGNEHKIFLHFFICI